jgi:hypothetical protein
LPEGNILAAEGNFIAYD